MSTPIKDYALLSDMHTGPLVSRGGSIDWLCFPRYDSPSIFAALLGTEEHGRWLLVPDHDEAEVVQRRYLPGSFVLETLWRTPEGEVAVTEFMPLGDRRASIVRRIEGRSGTVPMRQELTMRFDYARALPWVYRSEDTQGHEVLLAIAGPAAVALRGPELPESVDHRHIGKISVSAGEKADFELVWFPSHRPVPGGIDIDASLQVTLDFWQTWADECQQGGLYHDQVQRSLLVLRALTHEDTGGIVAAATTSLPEEFGGSRNWDYRYCWLRDAALTLEAMLTHGYAQEALTWRNWLLRAVAGDPEDLQIMYGLGGERELTEQILEYLPGYEDSRPVRIGNGAVEQYQADVVGEVMVALDKLRQRGVAEDQFSWSLQRALLGFAERHFDDKDQGVLEMRSEPKYFTHSRVMMWAAFDRGIKAIREYGLEGPEERWIELRDRLYDEVMEHGYNEEIESFTQTYGGATTDASLLVLPHVGFLSYDDPKMLSTVARMEDELLDSAGLLLRYRTEEGVDGLEPGEHPFLACSFWLVEQYAYSQRVDEARELMQKLINLGNELGLFSEEYDTEERRMAGNFPQAFSHLALVRAADALHRIEACS
ncbi:glycoside hydrolase family 15 protein [Acaricomes phytoseiuli]|uniref:glycoside hydrolase family 15 protein n=1 Tax=Acaricomes phytoseiuli TaxID=291968 RepID=UPI002221CAC6|nr:glycoside hydrolase family 15 protein [Acaricomes phytoseiuli]MCW1250615.1 glycoside hydrolase family 15 protein [Acaricomes phytoseiuli]